LRTRFVDFREHSGLVSLAQAEALAGTIGLPKTVVRLEDVSLPIAWLGDTATSNR